MEWYADPENALVSCNFSLPGELWTQKHYACYYGMEWYADPENALDVTTPVPLKENFALHKESKQYLRNELSPILKGATKSECREQFGIIELYNKFSVLESLPSCEDCVENDCERVNCCHKLNNTHANIIIDLFADIISRVIGKSTLQDDEKYVSDDSHPSNLSVPNVFNPSENSEDDLLTNISTVLQGPKLSKDKKSVSKKRNLS